MNLNSKKKSLTVVIPIYNSLKFKSNILKIINENNTNCEFILIDDGNNQRLFEEIYHECTHKINIIHNKKNLGVSYSRNIGIKTCKTKYITFCDSDDFILLGKEFTKSLKKPINSELIICKTNISNFFDEIKFSKKKHSYNVSEKIKNNLIINYLSKPVGTSPFIHCWGSIYHTDFLKRNKIIFNKNLQLHEDSLFFAKCITKAKKIKFYNHHLYNHNLTTKALSSGALLNPSSFIFHLDIYKKYLIKNKIKDSEELYFKAIGYYLSKLIVSILNLNFIEIYRRLRNISKDDKIISLLKNVKFKCEKIPTLNKWMLNYPKLSSIVIYIHKITNN